MKKLLLGITLAILTSCKKTPDELNVVARPTTFNQVGKVLEGGTFEIASNASWAVIPSAEWVHVSKESGNGNQTITISVDAGTEDRTASITVQAGGIVKTIPVLQVFDVFAEMDDETFRDYCKTATYYDQQATEIRFDSNQDGILSLAEAAEVNRVEFDGLLHSTKLTSLRGIEYFTGVEVLYCGNNTIASLDLRKNTKLTDLHCSYNQLSELNVYGCTLLRDMECGNNPIESLDVSTNVEIETLSCCKSNITFLDVSLCTKLKYLDVGDNAFKNLDLQNNTGLIDLYCHGNQLTELDISGCYQLQNLDCSDNRLVTLDVKDNLFLESLRCSINRISSLDVKMCEKMTNLDYAFNGDITTLDISRCKQLSHLSVGSQMSGSKTTVYVWPEFDTATPSNSITSIVTYGNGSDIDWVR